MDLKLMDLKLMAGCDPMKRMRSNRTRYIGNGFGAVRAAALASWVLLALSAGRSWAATDVEFWHAMSGELGHELDRLVGDFNRSQPDYRIVATNKGNYTETVTAAIFAVRTRTQPAIVQVNEVATATMMAAKGAVYPVFELMRQQKIPFDRDAFLPAISGYYADLDGNLLSYPFNASTPILYYNKDLFRAAGLDDKEPPKTWPQLEAVARKLRQSGVACGFSTHWPSWVNVENFSAFHDVPLATKANGLGGFDAQLTINNPLMVRHVAALAEWQKTKLFDYGGRAQAAEPRFPSGTCAIFLGSSALRALINANSRFAVGYGMLPYWPDVAGAPQNSIIGGATLWVLSGKPKEHYAGVAKFFTLISSPEVQANWHQATGYVPITLAAYELTKSQGFYDKNPGRDVAVLQLTNKPPTPNSKGLRLGNFVQIRDVEDEELEGVWAGQKTPKEALDEAVKRGNALLRQFQAANPQ